MISVFIILDDIIWNCLIFFHDVLESTLENFIFAFAIECSQAVMGL
ncbi:hypothetical protein V3C99_007080 [Haemonchus contortus]